MIDRRHFLLASAAGAAALATPAFAFEKVGDRRMMVFSGGQPVPVLDPHVRYDWSTRMMQQAVYDALAKYEGNPSKVVPWLAESWETSPDGLVWTFHLVANAKFHNGDPVDAEAVRYSFERALKLNKGVAWMLKDHLDPSGIKAVDARTVQLHPELALWRVPVVHSAVVHRQPEAGDRRRGRRRLRAEIPHRRRCRAPARSGSSAGTRRR